MDTLLGLHGRFRIPFADKLEMGCERGERARSGPSLPRDLGAPSVLTSQSAEVLRLAMLASPI
jgi:hypothetical protein